MRPSYPPLVEIRVTEHSSTLDRWKGPILRTDSERYRDRGGPPNAILWPLRNASGCHLAARADRRRDLLPAIDPALTPAGGRDGAVLRDLWARNGHVSAGGVVDTKVWCPRGDWVSVDNRVSRGFGGGLAAESKSGNPGWELVNLDGFCPGEATFGVEGRAAA